MANIPLGDFAQARAIPQAQESRLDMRALDNGRGAQALAQGLDNVGDVMLGIAQRQQKEEADNALIDYETKSSGIENGLLFDPEQGALGRKGASAIGIREQTLAEFDKRTGELSAQAPKTVQRQIMMLNQQRRAKLEESLMRHEMVERRNYNIEQVQTGIKLSADNAGMHFGDDSRVEMEAQRAAAFAAKLADLRGDAPDAETRTAETRQAVSDVYTAVINRKLQADPYEAERYAAQHKDKLTSAALAAIHDKVDPYVQSAEYDVIAADIVAGKGIRPPGDFSSAVESVLATEGGFNASDGNSGAPVIYGLNAKYNPAEFAEAQRITAEQGEEAGKRYAAEVYRDKYWNAAGIDSAPAAVRAQMFDAAVNMGVDTAKSLYRKSGGDPQKFAELRREHYRAIVAKDPSQAKYLNGWLARVDKYAGAAATTPPKSAAEAIARMREVEKNPRARRELETRIRFEFQLREDADQENRSNFSLDAYDRIMKSDGSVPIEKLFTPDEMRKAYEFGYLDDFRELYRMKIIGQQPQTDVKLYEELKREALLAPDKFKARNLPAIAAKLGTDDLGRLMGWQAEMRKPGAAQPEFITEQKQLGLAYTDMGLDGKGSAEQRAEFEKAYYREVKAIFDATGKKPSQQERQEIINQMKLPFVREGWFIDKTMPAYKAEPGKDKVPEADRARITAELRKAGVAVTEQRIVEVYLNQAGSDL